MRHKTILLASLLALCPMVHILGQQIDSLSADSLQISFWDFAPIKRPLLGSANVAAMGQIDATGIGYSQLQGVGTGGNFRRVQQPERSTALHFDTERYQSLKKSVWYGRFGYRQQWDKNIQWTDMLNPYRGTPYVLADSIAGDWRKQAFDLEAKVASKSLAHGRLHLGASALYQVATGAKQLDPRPLSYTNQFRVGPSVLWQLNPDQQLGLSAAYAIYQEDINLEIRRPNTSHNLYRFKGLSIHDDAIPISSGHSRFYKAKQWIGELQHQLQWAGTAKIWTSTLGYVNHRESTRDGSTLPTPAGDYASDRLQLNTTIQKRGKHWHQLGIKASLWDDRGTEYHTVYDANLQTYLISFSGIVYRSRLYEGEFFYRWLRTKGENDYWWLLETGLGYEERDETYEYTQPSEQHIARLNYRLAFAYNPAIPWRLRTQVAYQSSLSSQLEYTPKSGPNTTANELLFSDYDYLTAPSAALQLEAKRLLHIPKTGRSVWYIHTEITYKQRLDEPAYPEYDRQRIQARIGFGAYY